MQDFQGVLLRKCSSVGLPILTSDNRRTFGYRKFPRFVACLRRSLHLCLLGFVTVAASAAPADAQPPEKSSKAVRSLRERSGLSVSERRTAARLELVPKRPLPFSILGVNAFVNDQRFGSIRNQFREVKNTVRVRYVRVLFRWDDNVQRTPASAPNFAFYDDIIRNLPAGVDALVIMTGIPTWMRQSKNWIDGDPRKTFVEKWVRPVVTRYARKSRVIGWQMWNEPNMESDIENQTLGFVDAPDKYVEMLSSAYATTKALAPRKLVVSAATTAINQNYPDTLEYNEGMREAGVENVIDIWAVHYYGTHYENLLFRGVADFMNESTKPIWVTESGEKGIFKQLAYGQRVWPFLLQLVPGITRIYIYQFTESSPSGKTYGLRNLTPGFTVSDLYIHLRDRR